jgi:hypothetical protein
MCRIASLLLLQGLKGSMLVNTRELNNNVTQDVIKYFPAKQCTKGNSRNYD